MDEKDLTIIKKLKILACLLQSMTCKDAINSDTSSEEEKLYLLDKSRRLSKMLYVNLGYIIDSIRNWSIHFMNFSLNLNMTKFFMFNFQNYWMN